MHKPLLHGVHAHGMGFEANRPVETTLRTFEIIEYIRDTGSAGITEIAEEVGVSKGIAHNHVSTLRQLGYVIKAEDEYVLSSESIRLGQSVREGYPVYRHGTDVVDSLTTEQKTQVTLVGREAEAGIVLYEIGSQLADGTKHSVGAELDCVSSPLALLLTNDYEESGYRDDYTIEEFGDGATSRKILVGEPTASDGFAGVAVPIFDSDEDQIGVVALHRSRERDGRPSNNAILATVGAAEQIETRITAGWETSRTFAIIKHDWVE